MWCWSCQNSQFCSAAQRNASRPISATSSVLGEDRRSKVSTVERSARSNACARQKRSGRRRGTFSIDAVDHPYPLFFSLSRSTTLHHHTHLHLPTVSISHQRHRRRSGLIGTTQRLHQGFLVRARRSVCASIRALRTDSRASHELRKQVQRPTITSCQLSHTR